MPHWETVGRANSVVYVHGIGNQIEEKALKRSWDHALFRRDLGPTSSMAYWADIRYRPPLSARDAELYAGPPESSDYRLSDFDIQSRTSELRQTEDVDDQRAAEEFTDKYLNEAMHPPVQPAAAGSDEIERALGIPWFVRKPGFWLISKLFIKDAHAYFFNKRQREAIQARLRTQLLSAPPPVLLVAHSLGSIIAYDILRESTSSQLEAAGFITFGSQLGVDAVRDRIRQPYEVPPSVAGSWHNYVDKGDFSPSRKLLRHLFEPYVIDDEWADNPSPNNHDATSYLSDQRLQVAAYRVLPAGE